MASHPTSVPPWSASSLVPSPAAVPPTSESGPPPSSVSSSSSGFSSTFGAFNLRQPHTQPSNLTVQLESHQQLDPASFALHQRRGISTASAGAGFHLGGFPFSNAANGGLRRQSMLGFDTTMNSDDEDDDDDEDGGRGGSGARRTTPSRDRDDTMMSMSPGSESALPPSATVPIPRGTRSRSISEATMNPPPSLLPPPPLFGTIPTSPFTVARALQTGQKTPPPFLQRRLFKDENLMNDELAMSEGRSSRSGSSSDIGGGPVFSAKDKGKKKASLSDMLQDDEEIEELSATLSRSTSGEDGDRGVVRRPVSRRPNLLPKPKSHLRVLSELRSESAPADLAEIASEATLHRLSRSGASTVPPLRPSSMPGSSAAGSLDHRPPVASSSSVPLGGLSSTRPTPNRFPEQVDEDDPLIVSRLSESSSSNDEGDDPTLEVGSDWGGMSVGGYGTEEDEERSKMQKVWNGIRSGGGSRTTAMLPNSARSPGSGSERGNGGRCMEVENPFNPPQTPSSAFSTRPGKRKINDDRFEPYAHQAFKRRAVSPAGSLSLSPGFTSATSSGHPVPPPLPTLPSLPFTNSLPSLNTGTPPTLPVSIPSPTLSTAAGSSAHYAFFSSIQNQTGTRSVAGSPVASSLSSSAGAAGRGFMSLALSERYRLGGAAAAAAAVGANEHERSKVDDRIGRMSLGDSDRDRQADDEEEL
ncbi:hypothetical protein JCM1841_006002 [Sporobolomyces salmonicolor]